MRNWQKEHDDQVKFGNALPQEQKTIQFQPTKTITGNSSKRLPENEGVKEHGYMNFIRVLQEQKQEIVVIMAGGEVVRGVIKAADPETISLACPIKEDPNKRYRTRVLFKRQIAEFSPTKGIEDLVDEIMTGEKSKTV